MAEVTIDDIIARLKALQEDEEKLYQQQVEHRATLLKLDTDAKLLIGSGKLPQADKDRLLESLTDFMAESLRKVLRRTAAARKEAAARQETKDTAAALGDVSGGFPRLA